MFKIDDHKQLPLFDPWDYLSPKRRHILDLSWAGLFREEILPILPVRELKSCFSDKTGRPSKELHTMLGVLLLQQAHDLTDEETVFQFSFNIQWHYALNITEESDSAKYVSLKTLWTFRQLVIDKKLDTILFEKIAGKLAEAFNVNTDKQRIDSVHIKSNMRRLGRIGIFSKSIHSFLVNLKRKYPDCFQEVNSSIVDKYMSEKALSCFSLVKPSDAPKTLDGVSKDLFDLIELFKENDDVTSMYTYKQLERILKEQCNIEESDDDNKVELKKPKEIPSDSLQNPSDPDATYSGHKGQGYQVQIMETYNESDGENKGEELNLITYVSVEKASESDANALIPAIESVKERDLSPKEVQADSLYGSDENCETAKAIGVEVVSPTMGAKKSDGISLSDSEISEKGIVEKCPQGFSPSYSKSKKDRITQGFLHNECAKCPIANECPAKKGKKYNYLRYTKKAARLARRRRVEQTDEFKERYRWRAGVEATMSEYDRRTGVKHLRFRGLDSVRFAATLKATGLNIFRAAAFRKRQKPHLRGAGKGFMINTQFIQFVKELFQWMYSRIKESFMLEYSFHQFVANLGI